MTKARQEQKEIKLNPHDHSYLWAVDIDVALMGGDSYPEYDEREPGYALRYFKAFNWALKHIKNIAGGLNEEYIKMLHTLAMAHYKNEEFKEFQAGVYKKEHSTVAVYNPESKILCASKEGFQEFIDRWLIKDTKPSAHIEFKPIDCKKYDAYFLCPEGGKIMLYVLDGACGKIKDSGYIPSDVLKTMIEGFGGFLTGSKYLCDIYSMHENSLGEGSVDIQKIVQEKMDKIIKDYNEAVKKAKTPNAKIKLIVEYVQKIEQLHPFPDGNLRTMNILLNILLIKEGIAPTLLVNPNRLELFSIDQLVRFVKEGQKCLQAFFSGKLFSFPVNDPTLGAGEKITLKAVELDPATQKEADTLFAQIKSFISKESLALNKSSLYHPSKTKVEEDYSILDCVLLGSSPS